MSEGKLRAPWQLVVHGGAGAMRAMSATRERAYRAGLLESLEQAGAVLAAGSDAVTAAVLAVRVMERSGAFNAGRGACLDRDGVISIDAAVMAGEDLSIGALAGVPELTNGVEIAETLRSSSPHILLAGPAATRWAEERGLPVEREAPPPERLAHLPIQSSTPLRFCGSCAVCIRCRPSDRPPAPLRPDIGSAPLFRCHIRAQCHP